MVTGQVDRQGRLGMVWFDLEGSKSTTMSLFVNDKGRVRVGTELVRQLKMLPC